MEQENKDVEESLGLFEAAFQARHVELSVPTINSIVVLHDDSDQEETTVNLARAAASQFQGTLKEIPAPVLGMDASEKVALFQEELSDADLVVVPAPFGEDLGSLNTESLSSVIDLFLCETRKPLLVVRHPLESYDTVLSNPVVLLDWQERFQGIAASYGCCFAGNDGNLDLVAAIAPSTLDEITALIGENEDDMAAFRNLIQRAETRLSGGIVAAVQKMESKNGFQSQFSVHHGQRPASMCASRATEANGIAVCAYLPDSQSTSLSRMRDLILKSQQPVLCLPI